MHELIVPFENIVKQGVQYVIAIRNPRPQLLKREEELRFRLNKTITAWICERAYIDNVVDGSFGCTFGDHRQRSTICMYVAQVYIVVGIVSSQVVFSLRMKPVIHSFIHSPISPTSSVSTPAALSLRSHFKPATPPRLL